MSDMRALAYLVVLGLVFYVVWKYLGRNAGPKAKLGPDGTNVREPETFVVQSSPSPDASRYKDVKVEPTGEPELPTIRNDVELAEDLLPEQTLRSARGADAPAPTAGHRGRVILFRSRPATEPGSITEDDAEPIAFTPDADWSHEMAEEVDWEGLNDPMPFPARYTEEAITALVRNPRSLYVYWERSAEADQNLLSTLGEDAYRRSTPCLRITDVTPGADPGQLAGKTWLLDVSDMDDHWFVQDGILPAHTYEVSFGRRTADGRYIVLSHSLPVRTPHETPAPVAEQSLLYRLYVTQPGQQPGSPQWR